MLKLKRRKLRLVLKELLNRLKTIALPVIQLSLSAGIAWSVAKQLSLQIHNPYFAPIAAVISLGISLDQRKHRGTKIIIGVCFGIIIGSFVLSTFGEGWWQLSLTVASSMLAAAIFNKNPVTIMQSGTSSIIVATMVSAGKARAIDRLLDALIGALVGFIVAVILPTHPLARSREKAAKLLFFNRNIISNIAIGLANKDEQFLQSTLNQVREGQDSVNKLLDEIKAGKEIGKWSPYFHKHKDMIKKRINTGENIDNCLRNTRVLSRTALVAVDEKAYIDRRLVDMIRNLNQGFAIVTKFVQTEHNVYPDAPETIRVLRSLADKMNRHLPRHGGLYAAVIYSQVRSITIDLMQIAGLPLLEAEKIVPHKFIMDES